MNKEVIGIKSKKYINVSIVSVILMILLLMISLAVYIDSENIFLMFVFILLLIPFIFIFISLIKSILNKKVLVEKDNYGIYLNYIKRTIYIKNKDIEHVYSYKVRYKYGWYPFGYLYIVTKDKKYKIGVIDEVEEVEKEIEKTFEYKFKIISNYK